MDTRIMASSGITAGEFILLGRITKPHGIRGEVKVHLFSGQPDNFLRYGSVLLGPENSERRIPYKIEKARIQGKQVLVQLQGCTTRTKAESLTGWQVWLRSTDLPELDDGGFYLRDLEGKRIVTTDGIALGQVTGVVETAAHDILVITGKNQEYLIPVQKKFIARIGDDEVVLDVPPGLLDINR